jgi:hypothetical protein
MVSALALHPAERRRLARRMPALAPHDVLLRPVGGGAARAMIVSAAEQDFIAAVLADAAGPRGPQALAARAGRRRGADGVLELTQPVHRTFHLLVLEAVCRQPGAPRVDPRKLDGMGMVLRRVVPGGRQGWMRAGVARRGWRDLADGGRDPDPARWPAPDGANAAVARLLDARRGGTAMAEDVLPLFVAPADVCERAGRTLLFGLVPVGGAERADAAPAAPDYRALPADEAAALRAHLSSYLKPRAATPMPRAGQTLNPGWAPLDLPPDATGEEGQLRALGVFLRQLDAELGAFSGGEASRALLGMLARLTLPMARDGVGQVSRTMTADAFVTTAAAVLVRGEANTTGLAMPLSWPAIDAALGNALSDLALACLAAQHARLVPHEAKFASRDATYVVRGFMRVREHAQCPPRLVWSAESEKFRVAPWWDGDGPPMRISLPNISDFRKMKPNVSFELPPALANLLQGDAKKLKDGEGSTGGPDIFWLCSFSLPIITLCAFIVLNVFLSLFNVIFRWMAWIKICIPIPRPK